MPAEVKIRKLRMDPNPAFSRNLDMVFERMNNAFLFIYASYQIHL